MGLFTAYREFYGDNVCRRLFTEGRKDGTFHFQLSLCMSPVGEAPVHSDVIEGGLLDNEPVTFAVFLEAKFAVFSPHQLYILEIPEGGDREQILMEGATAPKAHIVRL